MPRPEQKRRDADPRTIRKKAGEVLTADLADALATEAEQGYDLTKAKRRRIKKRATDDQEPEPTLAKLDAAPYDDEELTDEDLRAVNEAQKEPGISWSDAEGS